MKRLFGAEETLLWPISEPVDESARRIHYSDDD